MSSNIQLTNDTLHDTSAISIDILLQKLDEAIDDLEQGRVQTLEEAWLEIDAIQVQNMIKKYKVHIAASGKSDIAAMKKYILLHFKYRELAENFSKKLKTILSSLDTFPAGHNSTEFSYKGHKIYLKPRNSYLIFYIINENTHTVTILRVLKDGMDWKPIIVNWLYNDTH